MLRLTHDMGVPLLLCQFARPVEKRARAQRFDSLQHWLVMPEHLLEHIFAALVYVRQRAKRFPPVALERHYLTATDYGGQNLILTGGKEKEKGGVARLFDCLEQGIGGWSVENVLAGLLNDDHSFERRRLCQLLRNLPGLLDRNDRTGAGCRAR